MKVPMPRFIMACLGAGLLTVSYYGVKPAVEFELNQRLSAVDLGYTQSCMSALGLLSLAVVGRASDAVGRKIVLLVPVGLLLCAFLYMATAALAPVLESGGGDLTPFDASVFPMVAGLLCIGVAQMSGGVMANALIADATAPLPTDSDAEAAVAKDRNKLFNRLYLAQMGALVFIAPKCIKIVKASYGLPGVFQALALGSGGILLIIAALPEKKPTTKVTASVPAKATVAVPPLSAVLDQVRGNRTLAIMFLMRFLHCLSAHLVIALLPRFVKDALALDGAALMDLYSALGGIFTLVQVLQPIVLAKLSTRTSLAIGIAMIGIGRVIFTVGVSDYNSCLRCYVVTLIGIGMYMPSYSSMVGISAPENMRGTILSLSASTESVSQIVMPIVGGYVVDSFGIWMPFRVSAAISLLNAVVAGIFYFISSTSNQKLEQKNKEKKN